MRFPTSPQLSTPLIPRTAPRFLLPALLLVHALAGAAPPQPPGPQPPGPVPQAAQPAALGQAALPWLADGGAAARQALALLRNAAADGLDPEDYGATALGRRLDGPLDAQAAAALERDLDAAMLRFLADLHDGHLASDYRPNGGAAPFDARGLLARAIRERRLDTAADAAAPAIPLYRRIRDTLRQYRELAQLYPRWPALPAVARPLAPGEDYAGAAQLRERLQLLGDLDPDAFVDSRGDHVYTPELAEAVKRFQARHGLAEDGRLGAGTLDALAVPLPQRVAQLELTLERLRWLPPLPQGRIVAVNLPAYRLWAFDTARDATEPALEMRVIVGTALKTPTPLFIGQMRYLEINPYWNVPRSIETAEILPKLARNPAYLRQNDMELVSASGQVLAESETALAALRAGHARVRQRPGAGNVLGALKFAMPNPMNIYLHSTSAKELFKRTRRDLSHGCIRVEQPVELAQFVLADAARWNLGTLQAAIDSGQSRTLTLPATVPVVLFYATAIVDRHGRAMFADDIYRRDAPLLRQLHAHQN